MLIIAYPCDKTFLARVPFQFELTLELADMDHLLADAKVMLLASTDLLRSAPHAADNGRSSTPVEVTVRTSVLRRLMGWSYETAHTEIDGSAKWRWFCRIYDHAVPNHSTLCEREQLLRPTTLHRLNDRVVQLAQTLGVTHGKKLRTDSTVIATTIHYPTDSRLLSDSARVLGRLCDQARRMLQPQTEIDKALFRNRSRRAQRLARQIGQRLRTKQGQKNLKNRRTPCIANWCGSWNGCWHRSSRWNSACVGAKAGAPWPSPICSVITCR